MPARRSTILILVSLTVLFLIDLLTPAALMVPMFYVIPTAMAGFVFSLLRGFLIAVLCVALSFAGHVYSQVPGKDGTELTNRVLVACLIMLTLLTAWFVCWLRSVRPVGRAEETQRSIH